MAYRNRVKDIPKLIKKSRFNEKKKLAKLKLNSKLEDLKTQSVLLKMEYVEKEKQISTFLECRKTFFGRVKYYFKYSKAKKNKIKSKLRNEEDETI